MQMLLYQHDSSKNVGHVKMGYAVVDCVRSTMLLKRVCRAILSYLLQKVNEGKNAATDKYSSCGQAVGSCCCGQTEH